MLIIVLVLAVLLIWLVYKKNKSSSPVRKTEWEYDSGEDILRHAPRPDPIRGFSNFPVYSVVGKKKTTNRKNTLHLRVASIAAAKKYAIETAGLIEPLEITVSSLDLAGEKTDSGLKIPSGASRWDAQIFENCCLLSDSKHIPPPFMEYITALGIHMSWLAGRNYAVSEVFKQVDLRERSALYGYAVHCSILKKTPGNLAQDSQRDVYFKFADAASRDIKICQSISRRPASDFWDPSKKPRAYQFAANFFAQNHITPSLRRKEK